MKKKKEKSFLSAFSICFIVVILAIILTWIIQAGAYDTIEYSSDKGVFLINTVDGNVHEKPATQEVLDEYNITAKLENFLAGNITKPMSIPGTYQKVGSQPQGGKAFLDSIVSGTADGFDIIFFIFMLGGIIGIINHIGAFNAGIAALAKISKGREQIIIIAVTMLIAFAGTVEGFCEETIALYPVLIPVFIAAGFDALTAVGAVYMGSTIGCMFSLLNPFSVGIASYAAGTTINSGIWFRFIGLLFGTAITIIYLMQYGRRIKKDPTKSLIFARKDEIEAKFAANNVENIQEFTLRMKIALIVFVSMFGIMIWGISTRGWWFTELAELFLVGAVIIGIIGGLSEKEIVSKFVGGAADLMGVALILGVARAVTIVMDNGRISGTILEVLSTAVSGLPAVVFLIILMLVYVLLGFFVNSSSGLAVLSIPIMAPLADVVGIPRELIVSAYIYGLGIITFITPTGIIMPSLEVVDVTYDRWLKFCMPLIGILTVFASIMLVVQYMFA